MNNTIQIQAGNRFFRIANSWYDVPEDHFGHIVDDMQLFSVGQLTADEVKLRHVMRELGIDRADSLSQQQIENLLSVAGMVTFLFDRDGNQPSFRFCRQFIPTVRLNDGSEARGYGIVFDSGIVACSLTARQYADAVDACDGGKVYGRMMASILYYDGQYDPYRAMSRIRLFDGLPENVINGIVIVFNAFVDTLFSGTYLSLLSRLRGGGKGKFKRSMADHFADLSKMGYGSIAELERMNVIDYLSLLYKNLVDNVLTLRGMKMPTPEIASKVGLPVEDVNRIVGI